MNTQWTIGIIGGSGLYAIDGLEDAEWRDVASPWGAPSDQILHSRIGDVARRFLPVTAARGWAGRRGATYLAMEGPQFSTRAESLLYRQWGADVIGMTAMPFRTHSSAWSPTIIAGTRKPRSSRSPS